MARKRRAYWDSCAWIGLICEEEDKIKACRHVIEQARRGELQILTSTFTLAEVYRLKCEESEKALPEEKDQIFEEFLSQEFIVYIQLTQDVGIYARRLLRRAEGLKKPQDAIHLASAAIYNADEFHTFDRDDLLRLDGKIDREDGEKLKICTPPIPSEPAQTELPLKTSETIPAQTEAKDAKD